MTSPSDLTPIARDTVRQPLTDEDKRYLESVILLTLPCVPDRLQEWYSFDHLFRVMKGHLEYGKRYNYFYESDVKNALKRLERRGSVVVIVRSRGWYRWKVYAYALPF